MQQSYDRITVCVRPPLRTTEHGIPPDYVYGRQPISPSLIRNTSPQTLPPPAVVMNEPATSIPAHHLSREYNTEPTSNTRQQYFTTLEQLQASHMNMGVVYGIPPQDPNIYHCQETNENNGNFTVPVEQSNHLISVKDIDPPHSIISSTKTEHQDKVYVHPIGPPIMKPSISELTLIHNDSVSIASSLSNTSNRNHLDASVDSTRSVNLSSQLELKQANFFDSRSASAGSCSSLKTIPYGADINCKEKIQCNSDEPVSTTEDTIVRKNEPSVTNFRQFKRRGRPKKDPLKEAEAIRKQYQRFLIEQENEAARLKRKIEDEVETEVRKQKMIKYENSDISTSRTNVTPNPVFENFMIVDSIASAEPVLHHASAYGYYSPEEIQHKKHLIVQSPHVIVPESKKEAPKEFVWYNQTHIHIDRPCYTERVSQPAPQNIVFCANNNIFQNGCNPGPVFMPPQQNVTLNQEIMQTPLQHQHLSYEVNPRSLQQGCGHPNIL